MLSRNLRGCGFSACACSFVIYNGESQNSIFVEWLFCFHLVYIRSLPSSLEIHLRGFPTCNVIVVKVIPEKTRFHAVCTNDQQLSTKLAQNLDHGCARQVGNYTEHCIQLLDVEPVKELTDWMSTCLELPRIASSWLGS